jgi:hypothetical protein
MTCTTDEGMRVYCLFFRARFTFLLVLNKNISDTDLCQIGFHSSLEKRVQIIFPREDLF